MTETQRSSTRNRTPTPSNIEIFGCRQLTSLVDNGTYVLGEEFANLLRCAADEPLRIEESVELGTVERHLGVLGGEIEEGISATLGEDRRRRSSRVYPQSFVHCLAVATPPHSLH